MKYDLIAATSMGVRLTPDLRQPVDLGGSFRMQATSAESNALNIAASLGLKTKVLTAFVKDSPIASFIRRELGRRFIAFEGPEIEQGGPWGYRHQFNIADSGYGVRGPRVHNDRAGEVGQLLTEDMFDLERILAEEGCRMLHFSGLFAALSPRTSAFCLALARRAKTQGSLLSFDLNYRASFWKGREEELRRAFYELAALCDVLIGNEEDYQLALGIPGPRAGGRNLAGEVDSFRGMIERVRDIFPQAGTFAATLREVLSANVHLWGAMLYRDARWHLAQPREIQVLDRIGGGDGFVGGLLYGLLRGWDGEKCLRFAWASGALAVTVLDDYASPQDEQQVWSVWEGNARVLR